MVTWQQFEQQAPELAAQVRARFEAHETHVLATLRKDGAPRVSGTEVDFKGEDLTFGSMLDAVKAHDLQRDGRLAIHAHPNDGDAKVAGVAEEVVEPDAKRALGNGTEPPGDFHAFRVNLTEAVLTTVDQAAQELVVYTWHPGVQVRTIRRK